VAVGDSNVVTGPIIQIIGSENIGGKVELIE
jgi:hypothetical protein